MKNTASLISFSVCFSAKERYRNSYAKVMLVMNWSTLSNKKMPIHAACSCDTSHRSDAISPIPTKIRRLV
jgi:hypothetical protein